MKSLRNTSRRLLKVVFRSPGCDLEDILHAYPDLTWNQIFLELDRLSRSGDIMLRQNGPGRYSVASRKPTTMTGTASAH
jgi:hypothetical protein